jgi:hypothetical protein
MKWPPGKRKRRAQDRRLDARARFARRMVYAEFGYRAGSALDHDSFEDRKSWQAPRSSPEFFYRSRW